VKKRAVVALGVVAAMLLTGCTKVGVKDDIIVVSDVKMDENKTEKVIEETVQEVPLVEAMGTIEDVVYENRSVDVDRLINSDYSMEIQLVSSVDYERDVDYRLHIYAKPEDGIIGDELLYTFPDVREGNQGIGKFQNFYFVNQKDLNDDGKLDVFAVGRYMTEEGLCYDTRVYMCNGKEYVPDYEYMDELNSTYHLTTKDALDYPIHEILNGMTIFSGEISIDKEKELSYFAYCEPQKADYQIVIMDEEGKLFQAITYHPEDWWADSYEPKIQFQDVNRDGISDIWLYLGCRGNAVIDGWTCFTYDETQQQYVEIEGFDELSNPYMNEWLRTGAKNGWGVYVRKVYEVEGTNLVLLETLTETNVEYEGKIWLYDEEVYEKGELVSKKEGVYAKEITSGYWDSVLMNTEDENKE